MSYPAPVLGGPTDLRRFKLLLKVGSCLAEVPHVLKCWCLVSFALLAFTGCGAPPRTIAIGHPIRPCSHAEFRGERVKIFNVRNCDYRSTEDYTVHYDDRSYDLDELSSVDFIVVPFRYSPALAHTMLSFRLRLQDYVAVSVEIRKERGEKYAPWAVSPTSSRSCTSSATSVISSA